MSGFICSVLFFSHSMIEGRSIPMSPDTTRSPSHANRLLSALPPEEYERLLPKMEEIVLTFDTSIYNIGEPISYVYFPLSGIISVLAAIEASSTLEVGIVGREGMVGLPLFMGVRTSRNKAIVQGKGVAMRIKAADF